jgi:hypothetical protein
MGGMSCTKQRRRGSAGSSWPKHVSVPRYASSDAKPKRADALATALALVGFVWVWVWLFPAGFDK